MERNVAIRDWNPPVLTDKKDIEAAINDLHLRDRRIKHIRFTDKCPHDRVEILEQNFEIDRSFYSNLYQIDDGYEYPRHADPLGPVLIGFEDGDVLEMNCVGHGRWQISMNTIDGGIEASKSDETLDAEILFSPCLGRTVSDITHTSPVDRDGMTHKNRVSSIMIRLSNGLSIFIDSDADPKRVECVDEQDKVTSISRLELLYALYNCDAEELEALTGSIPFEPERFLTKEGRKEIKRGFMTLHPDNTEIDDIFIFDCDFKLLELCISICNGSPFDYTEDYVFTLSELHQIFDTCRDLLVTYVTPKELHDHLSLVLPDHDRSVLLYSAECISYRKLKFGEQIDYLNEWLEELPESVPAFRLFHTEGSEAAKAEKHRLPIDCWYPVRLTAAEDIRKALDRFDLCGRRIKALNISAGSYTATPEHMAYHAGIEDPDNADLDAIDPGYMSDRMAVLDHTFMIEFEDGDVLEIDTPFQGFWRMSMNTIAEGINARGTGWNVDANILFSPCIGGTIRSVDTETFLSDPDSHLSAPFPYDPFENRSFTAVNGICLRLDSGIYLRLSPIQLPYTLVGCLEKDDRCLQIPFSELRPALKETD